MGRSGLAETVSERAPLFSPGLAQRWLADQPEVRHRQISGTMAYVDISGFTKLAERLVGYGRAGAEELVAVLGSVLESIIERASDRGGELIEFAGDSTLLLFTGDGHAAQACACTVEIRAVLREISAEPTEVGRVQLRASAGVHTGAFDFYLVGHEYRQLLCVGPETDLVLDLEHRALPGHIVVSETTASSLPSGSVRPVQDRAAVLRWRTSSRVAKPATRIASASDRPASDATVTARLLAPTFLNQVCDVQPSASHRVANIMFVELMSTTDRALSVGGSQLANDLDIAVQAVQRSLERHDVCVLSFDAGINATTVFACTGAPISSEDDEGRALRAALEIISAELAFPIRVGVNHGHVFAAEFGSRERVVYSAMGDTTNTASRICTAAGAQQLLVHPDVLASARQRYDTTAVGPVSLKGKALPQALYAVHGESSALNISPRNELPLIGRTSELDRLVEWLHASSSPVVFVTGEPGTGKSRLVREAVARAPHHRVLMLRTEPRDIARPYAPFRSGLLAHLQLDRLEPLERSRQLQVLLRQHAPKNEGYWPLVAELLAIDMASTPQSLALLPEHRNEQTAALVLSLLRAGSELPVVIVAEDGQWIDDASRRLLERLVLNAEDSDASIVITHREQADTIRVQFDGMALPEESIIGLTPLLPEETIQLARLATDAVPIHQSQLARLAERSSGNPLFLRELLNASQRATSTPETLLRTLVAELDHLDAPTRNLLEIAAVLGTSFPDDSLRALFAARGLGLDQATEQGASRFLDGDGDSWTFRHGLMRDAAYESMAFRRRRELHHEAGVLLERSDERSDTDFASLAYHFAAAGDQGKALDYSLRAATHSEATYAPVEAAQHLRQALHFSTRNTVRPDSAARDLWLRLARVLDHAALFVEAIAALTRAGALSTSPGERAEVELHRARVRERSGNFAAALAANTRAQTAVHGRTDDAATSVRAQAGAHAAIVYQLQGRATEAAHAAQKAMTHAQDSGDEVAMARACGVLARASLMAGEGGAPELARRAFALFEEVDDLVGQSRMANNLGIDAFYRGDWDEALRWYERCTEIAEMTGAVTDGALSRINRSELLVNQGRTAEAEPIIDRSRQDLRAANHWSVPLVDMHLGRLRMAQGDLSEAETLLRSSMEQSASAANSLGSYEAALFLGQCLVLLDRPQEALDQIASRAGVVDPAHRALHDCIRALVDAAALLRLDDRDAAHTTYRQGLQLATDRGLDFDRGQLLRFGANHGFVDEADLAEVDDLLQRFGVVATLPL